MLTCCTVMGKKTCIRNFYYSSLSDNELKLDCKIQCLHTKTSLNTMKDTKKDFEYHLLN